MVNPRHIEIHSYDYDLPDSRIAKYPLEQRDMSKLLVFRHGQICEERFDRLPDLIPAGSLVLFNNTRVIQARLHFRKATGALIEVFCLEPSSPRDYAQNFASGRSCEWSCLIGNSKKWKEGRLEQTVMVAGRPVKLYCERTGGSGASPTVRFSWEADSVRFADLLDAMGELPIPPYLNRATEEKDKTTYQTVYSRIDGSVAAPTAGLHFTETELSALRDKGVDLQYLTLHVGAGTFKPVKSERIEGHEMHTEFISVPRTVVARILQQVRHPERLLVAVGTTSVRTLESLYYMGVKLATRPDAHPEELVVRQWEPYDTATDMPTEAALQLLLDYMDRRGMENLVSATQILIAPGFRFRVVRAMVTNFHMPQSTLLLLVSAFVDGESLEGEHWHQIYRYALDHGFRFLSYGDSSLLFPD